MASLKRIPTLPALKGAKEFPSLKPVRGSVQVIPSNGTYHWYLCNPIAWANSRNWFPFKEENDILITSYPKCGHHLTQKLCLEVIRANHDGKYTPDLYATGDMGINTTPFLEFYVSHSTKEEIKERLDATDNMYPRIWFSHHSFDRLPINPLTISSKSKIITMIRNPKDCLVSSFIFFNKAVKQLELYENETEYTLDDLISYFVRGMMVYGCYFEWYQSYWNAINNNYNILWLYYEDVIDKPLESIKKVSNFIFDGNDMINEPNKVCNISDNGYNQIMERIKLDSVRQDTKDDKQTFEFGDILFRKGVNNDWKEHFNEYQSELIDETMYFKWAEKCNQIRYYQKVMEQFNEKYNKNYF